MDSETNTVVSHAVQGSEKLKVGGDAGLSEKSGGYIDSRGRRAYKSVSHPSIHPSPSPSS